MPKVKWLDIKTQSDLRKIPIQWIEKPEKYVLTLIHRGYELNCTLVKTDPPSEDQADFEEHYKNEGNKLPPTEVVGQMEKNDKTLKCFGAYGITDENGIAEICVPIPTGEGKNDGRYFAYGDAEFDIRHFKDRVIHIAVEDLDRRIAWAMALAMNPEATEPLPDEMVRGAGDQVPGGPFPAYPILDTYSENAFPEEIPANAKGEIFGGMTMSYKYGMTEVQPVGGYGYSPGGFYFVLRAKKDERVGIEGATGDFIGNNPTEEAPHGSRAGFTVAVTVDWARGDNV